MQRAVRFDAPGASLRLVEVPVPEPTGTQVMIRVAGCGVCHTDLHIVDGVQPRVELPLILGHEVSGWIDGSGSDADDALAGAGLSIGDAVLVHGGWGCGVCRECASEAEQRCPNGRSPGFQADGGYAEYMLVPHPRHLVALGSLDPVDAAPLADAGLTPYRAVRRAEPWLKSGGRVLVIGCGGLGQFALQYLRMVPAAGRDLVITVAERSAARLSRATELGADRALLDPDPDAVGPVDAVFDLVGSDETLTLAGDVAAPDGVVMLVGEAGGQLPFGFDRPAVEGWLTTTAWGSLADLRDVVGLARDGALSWTVERMPLTEAAAAHERVRRGEPAGRIVLVPASGQGSDGVSLDS